MNKKSQEVVYICKGKEDILEQGKRQYLHTRN